jgi:hypothetical protein
VLVRTWSNRNLHSLLGRCRVKSNLEFLTKLNKLIAYELGPLRKLLSDGYSSFVPSCGDLEAIKSSSADGWVTVAHPDCAN